MLFKARFMTLLAGEPVLQIDFSLSDGERDWLLTGWIEVAEKPFEIFRRTADNLCLARLKRGDQAGLGSVRMRSGLSRRDLHLSEKDVL